MPNDNNSLKNPSDPTVSNSVHSPMTLDPLQPQAPVSPISNSSSYTDPFSQPQISTPLTFNDPPLNPNISNSNTLEDSSVITPPPPPVIGDGGMQSAPPSGGNDNSFGSVTTSSSAHVPEKYGGKKVIATIFGVLLLVGAVAAGVALVRDTQLFNQNANVGIGNIAIFKFICDRVGDQDVCNGRDTSLGDYKVDFKVHSGDNDQGSVVQTITVTISDNQNGQGNTGNASQGRSVGDPLDSGTYTVCEIPIAYNATGDRVPLDVEPRPTASNGGSSGGTNQVQYGSNCITVDLNSGEAELKYLDKRQVPAATPIPTIPSSPTPTLKPGISVSPTSTVTITSTPLPTLAPDIVAKCLNVKSYDEDGNLLSATDLSNLKVGSKVVFAVAGQANSGTFSKARFSVNGVSIGETTNTNSNGEYYLEYTIPSGVSTFMVKGEVNHSTLGWI